MDESIPAVAHDGAHSQEHDARSDAACGEVSLLNRQPNLSPIRVPILGPSIVCLSSSSSSIPGPWPRAQPQHCPPFSSPSIDCARIHDSNPISIRCFQCIPTHLVLDGLIAALGGHVLNHGGQSSRGINWAVGNRRVSSVRLVAGRNRSSSMVMVLR